MTVELTMLNSMAGTDFQRSAERHRAWGLNWMDLKDAIHGRELKDVPLADARRIRRALAENGLQVYCFSTQLFAGDVSAGREAFATRDLADLEHVVALAGLLRPRFVRLIAAQLPERRPGENAVERLARDHPWVLDVYRLAVDRIADAGCAATIENESRDCILSTVDEFRAFFAALDRPGTVSLTWDAQNQWATGPLPTVDVYEQLRELIAYFHVKGGKADGDGALAWKVALDESTWPVAEVTQRVVDDGVSPVICLNPPGGGRRIDGYPYGDDVTERDLAFLRTRIAGIA